MKNGRGQEFDHPYKLLVNDTKEECQKIEKTDGYFAKMVLATGEETA